MTLIGLHALRKLNVTSLLETLEKKMKENRHFN